MNYTDSIDELAQAIKIALSNSDKISCALDLLVNYKGDDWQTFKKFSTEKYQRVLLYQDKEFEIMLICWDANQSSKIHDHAANGCAQTVLQGRIFEELFDKNNLTKPIRETILERGNKSYIEDQIGLHRISNPDDSQACSLHVYSPPNFKHTEY